MSHVVTTLMIPEHRMKLRYGKLVGIRLEKEQLCSQCGTVNTRVFCEDTLTYICPNDTRYTLNHGLNPNFPFNRNKDCTC
jgi:hypothetical protein